MTIHVAQWEELDLITDNTPYITQMPNGNWMAVRASDKVRIFEDRIQAAQWALEVQ